MAVAKMINTSNDTKIHPNIHSTNFLSPLFTSQGFHGHNPKEEFSTSFAPALPSFDNKLSDTQSFVDVIPSQYLSQESSTKESDKCDLDIPKPKRARTAYNFFFRHERARILMSKDDTKQKTPSLRKLGASDRLKLRREKIRSLLANNPYEISNKGKKRPHRKTHGKIGFADLARNIAEMWKSTDSETKAIFNELAKEDKERHQRELDEYNSRKRASLTNDLQAKKQFKMSPNPDYIVSSVPKFTQDEGSSSSVVTPRHGDVVCDSQQQQQQTSVGNDDMSKVTLFESLSNALDCMDSTDVVKPTTTMITTPDVYFSSLTACSDNSQGQTYPRNLEEELSLKEDMGNNINVIDDDSPSSIFASTEVSSDLKLFLSELDWSRI